MNMWVENAFICIPLFLYILRNSRYPNHENEDTGMWSRYKTHTFDIFLFEKISSMMLTWTNCIKIDTFDMYTLHTAYTLYPVTTIYDESALWCCQKQEKIGRQK